MTKLKIILIKKFKYSSVNTSENETIEREKGKLREETFKCSMCHFITTHNPCLRSNMTKMHVQNVKYSSEECSETFDTIKKFKISGMF